MGTALSTFADLTFFNLEPILLYEYGFDNVMCLNIWYLSKV